MEPKSGWKWFTLMQFAEKYGFEWAYVRHHRETGELKVKYLHYDDNNIASPADEPLMYSNRLPSEYTVVLLEEAERFAKEHHPEKQATLTLGEVEGFEAKYRLNNSGGTPVKRTSKTQATSRKDALEKILLQEVVDFVRDNSRKPTGNEVMNRLKRLSKERNHPVIQEVKSSVIYWRRANGKEAKTTFSALQKRLSSINKGQKTLPAND